MLTNTYAYILCSDLTAALAGVIGRSSRSSSPGLLPLLLQRWSRSMFGPADLSLESLLFFAAVAFMVLLSGELIGSGFQNADQQ